MLRHAAASLLFAASAAAASQQLWAQQLPAQQSREDAWWTGPMLIPRFFFDEPAGAPNSSGVKTGDLTPQFGYGLTHFRDGGPAPDISLVVQETLPTGSYDRLARGSDGVGAGAHTTSSFTADAAAEYSLTRSWVLAFDVVYQHNDSTRVTGRAGPGLRGALLVQVEKAFRAPTPDSDGELMTVVNVRLGECVLMSRSLNGDAGSASNELTASGLRSELRVERGAEL